MREGFETWYADRGTATVRTENLKPQLTIQLEHSPSWNDGFDRKSLHCSAQFQPQKTEVVPLTHLVLKCLQVLEWDARGVCTKGSFKCENGGVGEQVQVKRGAKPTRNADPAKLGGFK